MLMRNQKKETWFIACCLAETHALQSKASDTCRLVDESPSCSWAPDVFFPPRVRVVSQVDVGGAGGSKKTFVKLQVL